MVEWASEWREHLIWCPSQCYRDARVNGKTYTLYLRWRWSDPWQFRIHVPTAELLAELGLSWEDVPADRVPDITFITGDLFEERGLYFRDEEWKQAEAAAESIFQELAESGELEALRSRARERLRRYLQELREKLSRKTE